MHSKIGDGILSIEEGRDHVYSFDLEGRLINYISGSNTYRRTLQNRVILSRIDHGTRVSTEIPQVESEFIINQAYSEISRLIPSISDREIIPFLAKIESMNWLKLQKDAEKLFSIYSGSVPIVPPDQYFALYVMLERGCRWNRCSFCELYRDRTFRILNEDEIEGQVLELERYFGEGIESRRSIFLGEANALGIPFNQLMGAIDILNKHFQLPIYSFSEPFTGSGPKSVSELKELRSHGLKRVYLGLESGSPEILRLINKPMRPEGFREYVHKLKAAGISAGVIVMLGIGGNNFYEQHVEMTSALINSLQLGAGDIVYMSPFVMYPDFKYNTNERNIEPLSDDEIAQQGIDIRKKLNDEMNKENRSKKFPIALYKLLESQY